MIPGVLMETEGSLLGVQLQGTYVQRQLARTNRNLFLMSVAIIIGIGCYGVSESRYFDNFFKGPNPMSGEALAVVRSPDALERYFVSVRAEDSLDTGVQFVEKRVSSSGSVESETVKAGYSILMLGKRLLIVKRDPNDTGKKFEGALIALPADVRSRIVTPLLSDYPNVDSLFLPTMLDATGFRSEGYIAFAISIPLILFALWNLRKIQRRKDDPLKHPILKSLSRYGSLADSARQIDSDTNGKGLWRTTLGQSWILRPSIFALAVCHIPDIIWGYKKVTKHSVNLIPTGKSYAVVMVDRYGVSLELSVRKHQADELLVGLCAKVPWAVFGFTDELNQLAHASWPEFVAAVDARRFQG